MNTIYVPQQTINIPDREPKRINAFRISAHPVNVAAFRVFAQKTSYVTKAEQLTEEFNVYANPLFEDFPVPDSKNVPAACVSREDAQRFCTDRNFFLPTADQWIAFIKYVCDNDLFAWRKHGQTAIDESSVSFYSDEWLESLIPLVGIPPMKKLPGVPHRCEPHEMIKERPSTEGNLSVTFRVIVRDV